VGFRPTHLSSCPTDASFAANSEIPSGLFYRAVAAMLEEFPLAKRG